MEKLEDQNVQDWQKTHSMKIFVFGVKKHKFELLRTQ